MGRGSSPESIGAKTEGCRQKKTAFRSSFPAGREADMASGDGGRKIAWMPPFEGMPAGGGGGRAGSCGGMNMPAVVRGAAETYVPLRRSLFRLRQIVRFRLLLYHHSVENIRNAIAMEAWTEEMDARGMIANVKLPDVRWLRNLLTSDMLCRVEIVLPDGRGCVEADAVAAWAEAFHSGDPCRIGLAFVRVSGPDFRRLTQFVRDCQTKALRRMA
jgi:hypothetical protein